MLAIHQCEDLIALFNSLFEQSERTILVGFAEEPIYLPCDENSAVNRIFFTRDYFASALHEIAHWCIASEERRKLIDYGYWYYPEGRSAEQQILFEQAEVKPQALECIFSMAAGSRFIVSQDNLAAGQYSNTESFEKKVAGQVQRYLTQGLPVRAATFKKELLDFYQHRNN
jgi:elongation factor P hydroxylase